MRLFSQISVRVLIFGNFEFSNLFSQIRLKKRHTSFFSGNRREIRTKLVNEFQNRLLQNRYRTYSTWWRTRWGATSGASLGFPRMDFPTRFLQMFRKCQIQMLLNCQVQMVLNCQVQMFPKVKTPGRKINYTARNFRLVYLCNISSLSGFDPLFLAAWWILR